MNEYLKEFESIHNGFFEGFLAKRVELISKYSYAIPNDEAIDILTSISKTYPIIEIGAGKGYWSYLIQERGGDIKAYDKYPQEGSWTLVKEGDEKVLEGLKDIALLLCWPYHKDESSFNILSKFEGNLLIYIGESKGGCTGCNNFFELIGRSWELKQLISIPQWWSCRDNLYIFERINENI